jgi:hypothetical protein
MGVMSEALGEQGASRIREEDGMPTAISSASSADGPGEIDGPRGPAGARLGKSAGSGINNPRLAETREVAMSYISCSEEMGLIAEGSRAMKRWGGTCVMACGVEREDFKKMRALLAAGLARYLCTVYRI